MAIKRKGILAVPGEYKYGDIIEVKTAEELKLAAERQPMLSLTMGHPTQMASSIDVIGTVSQKWDEKNQRVNGEFWFHDDKISDELKQKLVNNVPVSISAGVGMEDVVEGVQTGMYYDHIAILGDEDPICPLGECGVNIRMESKTFNHYRYEQKTELDVPKQEEEVLPEAIPETISDEVVEEEIVPEKTEIETPAVHKPEEEVEPEPVEKAEVKLVPETIIPTDSIVHKQYDVINGKIVFVPQIFQKEKK